MTIICAIHTNEGTWIGSDQRSVIGNGVPSHCGPKWTVGEHGALAFAGPAMWQFLADKNRIDLLSTPQTIYTLAVDLKRIAVAHDIHPNSKERYFPDYGVEGIYATRDGVWMICNDLAFEKMPGFWACGSGGAEARGAYMALQEYANMDPISAMERAIDTACELDTSCGGSAWVDKLD